MGQTPGIVKNPKKAIKAMARDPIGRIDKDFRNLDASLGKPVAKIDKALPGVKPIVVGAVVGKVFPPGTNI